MHASQDTFERAAAAMLESEVSLVLERLGELRAQGVTDLRAYCLEHTELPMDLLSRSRLLRVNTAALALFEVEEPAAFLAYWRDTVAPETMTMFRDQAVAMFEGKATFRADTVVQTFLGRSVHVLITVSLPGPNTPQTVLCTFADISELKRSEAARSLSEELLQHAIRASGLGIFEHDHLQNRVTVSAEAVAMWGDQPSAERVVSPEQILDMVQPADRKGLLAAMLRAHDPRGDGTCRHEHRTQKLGRWVRVLSQTFFAGHGEQRHPVRTVGTILDITEQKRREIERENERAMLELIARDAPVERCLTHATQSQESLLPGCLCTASLFRTRGAELSLVASSGVPEDMLGVLSEAVVDPEAPPLGAARERRLLVVADLASDPRFRRAYERLKGFGVRAWWSAPLVASDGGVHGSLDVFCTAPRTPQPAELASVQHAATLASLAIERRHFHDALAQSELRLRLVFDHAPIGMYMGGSEGQITYANPALEKIFGAPPQGVVGTGWSKYMEPVELERALELSRSLQAPGEGNIEYVTRIVRPDGDVRVVRAQINRVPGGERSDTALVGIVEDISERLRLEERLRQAQKMEAVGQLAGGVAHDFNNLLTVILNGVWLLDAKAAPAQKELLGQVEVAASRAAALTSQLLAFSRRHVMRPTTLDLRELVVNHCKMLSRLMGERVVIETELAARTIPVEADPNLIEQLLMNLVLNARDAMPSGGTVTVSVLDKEATKVAHVNGAQGPFVRISVRDTGIGISSQQLPHLFEPFYTTKEPGKGTGLGLATAYGIVEMHRGKIEIETELDVGSTFHVYLPCANREPLAPERAPAPSDPAFGNERVLLVEDEPSVRQIARAALERCGYRVQEASDGDDALATFHGHGGAFDLLLTDLIMPGTLSGRELARRLREERPDLPVVYMSGYGAHDLTLDDHHLLVQKPFQLTALAKAVRDTLDRAAPLTRKLAAASE